jgi:hypothetical protein
MAKRAIRLLGLVALGTALAAAPVAAEPSAGWNPPAWGELDTIEIRTTDAQDGEHWFKVWPVVLDGALYVRLGTRAFERIQSTTGHPYISIRVDGQRFDRVRVMDTPEQAVRVAEAMASKYWTDLFIRFFPHPMTARLDLDPTP